LERRFRELLGRSPKSEIARVQLDCAKRLLTETDLSIDVVAQKAGFRSACYLCDVFSHKVGLTPGAYRKQL
jgi:LacI family transcriptional regulator